MVGLAAALGHYALASHERPEVAPDARLRKALLFGGGVSLGAAATRELVRNGRHPIEAFALLAVAGAGVRKVTRDTPIETVATGAMWGSGAGAIGAAAKPHWAIGYRPRLFVSHAFRDTEEYLALRDTIDESGLTWFDHSVPVFDRFPTASPTALRAALRRQIRGCSALVLLAGPGVSRRPCIRDEVFMAMAGQKPVLVVDQDPAGTSPVPALLNGYPLMKRVTLDEASSIVRRLTSLLARRG